jgi:hypothetical protein
MFVKHLTTILATLSLLLAFTTALPQSTTPVNPPSDFRANRWCSWCFKFPDAKNQSYCNIVVQTPGNINRYPNGYPAMVFNHNFQQLLWARDVGQFDTVHDIYFPAPQEKQAIGVHVLLVPSHRVNNTKEAYVSTNVCPRDEERWRADLVCEKSADCLQWMGLLA